MKTIMAEFAKRLDDALVNAHANLPTENPDELYNEIFTYTTHKDKNTANYANYLIEQFKLFSNTTKQ